MPNFTNGVDESFWSELEELLKEDGTQETPPASSTTPEPATQTTEPANEGDNAPVDTTKAFAKRLKESTDKARSEEREAIAKSLGYTSYADMTAKRERDLLTNRGIDPEDAMETIDEIVKQRLNDNPQMKELAKYREREMLEFGKRELAEITKLTDGEITSMEQIPREVLDAWKTCGSLKSAYLQIKGEELINRTKANQTKGTTNHLATPTGTSTANTGKRYLNDSEKAMWRFFNPTMTDEELNKKQVDNK